MFSGKCFWKCNTTDLLFHISRKFRSFLLLACLLKLLQVRLQFFRKNEPSFILVRKMFWRTLHFRQNQQLYPSCIMTTWEKLLSSHHLATLSYAFRWVGFCQYVRHVRISFDKTKPTLRMSIFIALEFCDLRCGFFTSCCMIKCDFHQQPCNPKHSEYNDVSSICESERLDDSATRFRFVEIYIRFWVRYFNVIQTTLKATESLTSNSFWSSSATHEMPLLSSLSALQL